MLNVVNTFIKISHIIKCSIYLFIYLLQDPFLYNVPGLKSANILRVFSEGFLYHVEAGCAAVPVATSTEPKLLFMQFSSRSS